MQIMSDAIAVLGARHGMIWAPFDRSCRVIRFDAWEKQPRFDLEAGIKVGGDIFMFPLCEDGGKGLFLDQRLTPCSMEMRAQEPQHALELRLEVVSPFRPRDLDYSTTPVLGIRLSAKRFCGWVRAMFPDKAESTNEAELFLRIKGLDTTSRDDGTLDVQFTSTRFAADPNFQDQRPQHDRLLSTNGQLVGETFRLPFQLTPAYQEPDGNDAQLDVFWCACPEAAMEIKGELKPFSFADRFATLDAVCEWAREQGSSLFTNAENVRRVVSQHNAGREVEALMAQSLHSWLINTWLVRDGGTDRLLVTEGLCHMHSTVDVEFSQSPFYLAVWPDLLKLQLDYWPNYSLSGAALLGEAHADTLFLQHDSGLGCIGGKQAYGHQMEVEEIGNYLILLYAYYERTGDKTLIEKWQTHWTKYLAFLRAADTTGNGIPDKGTANTIDDASPAIQYGEEQTYLGVKTLAALLCGAAMLDLLGRHDEAEQAWQQADLTCETIESQGWLKDHYAALLKKGGWVRHPEGMEPEQMDEIPGWDATHIYTANTMALLDMIGLDTGLSRERIVTDIHHGVERCLSEYGCLHSDFGNTFIDTAGNMQIKNTGGSKSTGWVSMNMLRDMAAFYRGIDLRYLASRYWDYQGTTNSREIKIFYETFNGSNLCYYPRGIACWGFFEALAGVVINRDGVTTGNGGLPQIKVPLLFDANWLKGTCRIIAAP